MLSAMAVFLSAHSAHAMEPASQQEASQYVPPTYPTAQWPHYSLQHAWLSGNFNSIKNSQDVPQQFAALIDLISSWRRALISTSDDVRRSTILETQQTIPGITAAILCAPQPIAKYWHQYFAKKIKLELIAQQLRGKHWNGSLFTPVLRQASKTWNEGRDILNGIQLDTFEYTVYANTLAALQDKDAVARAEQEFAERFGQQSDATEQSDQNASPQNSPPVGTGLPTPNTDVLISNLEDPFKLSPTVFPFSPSENE